MRISRRTMLQGMGASLALPWLEAMRPAWLQAAPNGRPPLRMIFMYHPLGAESTACKGVTGAGRDMVLTPTLRALEPIKEQLLILDGLNGRPHPASGHNRSACLWLSSALPGRTDTWGVETDVTLDQVLAPRLSNGARQRSLELSCANVGELMHAMFHNWRAPGVPLGAETDPREVFGRMFGDARRDFYQQSILDVVAEDARSLRSNLGRGDQRRLDEYLESVRTLERDIAAFERGAANRPRPAFARPEQPPATLRDYVRLMADLAVLALQVDFTRVVTLAPGDESESGPGTTYHRTLADFGIDRAQFNGQVEAQYLDFGHHKCSHDPRPTLAMIQAIDRWYIDHFLYLVQKLQATRDGDGTLLDNSIVVYGCTNSSGTGNGWPGHSLRDVLCLLAGKGGGLLPRPGRQLRFADNTPLSNLWLTLAQMTGVERREFGRSTGTLGLG